MPKKIEKCTKDITIINDYYDENFNFGDSLGNYKEDYAKKYPFMVLDFQVEIVGKSEYNKFAKVCNLETVDIKDDEYAIVSNYEAEEYQEVLNRNSVIKIFGKDLKPYKKIVDGFLIIGSNPSNIGFFVVDDSILKSENKNRQILVGNYTTDDKEIIKNVETKIKEYKPEFAFMRDTKNEIKDESVGISAIVTFIGLYLGIIFLISSSAILEDKNTENSNGIRNLIQLIKQEDKKHVKWFNK